MDSKDDVNISRMELMKDEESKDDIDIILHKLSFWMFDVTNLM